MTTELERAAQAVLDADAAYRDAVNGIGHKGEPHDRVLAEIIVGPNSPDFQIIDTVGDCSACGGVQYGTEDQLHKAYGDLRVALGGERLPWE